MFSVYFLVTFSSVRGTFNYGVICVSQVLPLIAHCDAPRGLTYMLMCRWRSICWLFVRRFTHFARLVINNHYYCIIEGEKKHICQARRTHCDHVCHRQLISLHIASTFQFYSIHIILSSIRNLISKKCHHRFYPPYAATYVSLFLTFSITHSHCVHRTAYKLFGYNNNNIE